MNLQHVSVSSPLIEEDGVYGEIKNTNLYRKCSIIISEAVKGRFLPRDFSHPYSFISYELSKRFWYIQSFIDVVYLLLAFVEVPSWCIESDCGHSTSNVPTFDLPSISLVSSEIVGLVCLFVYSLFILADYLSMGKKCFFRNAWSAISLSLVLLSAIDCVIAFVNNAGLTPTAFRLTRILRPLIFITRHPKLRRAFLHIFYIIRKVLSLFALLIGIVFFFGWFAILLFSGHPWSTGIFGGFERAFITLFVTSTTSNFPDVMVPAYTQTRLAAVFFIVFLVLTLFLLTNLILAIIYEYYRDVLRGEFRLRLRQRKEGIRTAFRLLAGAKGAVDFETWSMLYKTMRPRETELQRVFDIFEYLDEDRTGLLRENEFVTVCVALRLQHLPRKRKRHIFSWTQARTPPASGPSPLYSFFYTIVNHWLFDALIDSFVLINGAAMAIETQKHLHSGTPPGQHHQTLHEVVFAVVFAVEMLLRLVVYGPVHYWRHFGRFYDGMVTVLLVVTEAILLFNDDSSPRPTVTLLIHLILVATLLRLARLLSRFTTYRVVFRVITKLVPAFIEAAAMLLMIFYIFAVLGLQLFGGLIRLDNAALSGTTFATSGYYVLNFNDFASALVTLFCLLVVNNWYIIMDGHVAVTSEWARVFFLLFYFFGVVICLNLIVAFILEVFMKHYDAARKSHNADGVDEEEEIAPVRSAREKLLVELFKDELDSDGDTSDFDEA